MRKLIITEKSDGSLKMESSGFTPIEALGVLRYAEKNQWLQMVKASEKNNKTAKKKK